MSENNIVYEEEEYDNTDILKTMHQIGSAVRQGGAANSFLDFRLSRKTARERLQKEIHINDTSFNLSVSQAGGGLIANNSSEKQYKYIGMQQMREMLEEKVEELEKYLSNRKQKVSNVLSM